MGKNVGQGDDRRPLRQDLTTNLESVARGVRRLEEIDDPLLRDAVSAALGPWSWRSRLRDCVSRRSR